MSFGGRALFLDSKPTLLEIRLFSYHSKKAKEVIKSFHFTGDTSITPNVSSHKNHLLWNFVNTQVSTQIQQEILRIYTNHSFLGIKIATCDLNGEASITQ